MEDHIKEHYRKSKVGELITVRKSGHVNIVDIIIDPIFDQLISHGDLYYLPYIRANLKETYEEIPDKEVASIKEFNAIYFNGVQIVRKGKVCY